MSPAGYNRKGVSKPKGAVSTVHEAFHHSIDREIDNDSIWYCEVNGRETPLTLERWEEMKERSKVELHAKVIFRWVNKRSDKIERY